MTLAPLRRAVADVERLAAGVTTAEGTRAYEQALEHALANDAWDADRRAAQAAARLGLHDLDADRPVRTLSGGQRTRLALATVMTTRPGCLLLDEPTNHLDDDAIEVLTAFLRDLPGVVVLASHDRVLLDDVCTDLVHLDAGALGTDGSGGRRFGGGWSAYEAASAESRRRWEETYAFQQEELHRLRAGTRIGSDAIAHDRGPSDGDTFICSSKGGRVDRTLARRKKDARRRLEDAERDQVRRPPAPLVFRGDLTTAGRLVDVRDVEVADPARFALAAYDDAVRALVDPPPLREVGLLHPRDHRTAVGHLSVGQRRRLALAVAIDSSPDLLLLDEPTNHVSLALAGEFEQALATSPSALDARLADVDTMPS